MEVSGEAADLVMKEGVQISEEAIKLLARGAKNLAALLYALAKDQKKLYGKVNMNRLLSEQRPIEVLPLRTEDFDEFKRRAKKVGLLFSTILDKKGDAPYLEILTNIDHLSQAPLLPKLRGHFAEFLGNTSSAGLRILSSSTCVGLRYGYNINNSGFS